MPFKSVENIVNRILVFVRLLVISCGGRDVVAQNSHFVQVTAP